MRPKSRSWHVTNDQRHRLPKLTVHLSLARAHPRGRKPERWYVLAAGDSLAQNWTFRMSAPAAADRRGGCKYSALGRAIG
jgi:hypothetical protein